MLCPSFQPPRPIGRINPPEYLIKIKMKMKMKMKMK